MTRALRLLPILLPCSLLVGCHHGARPSALADLVVLEIAKPVYAPAAGTPRLRSEASSCSGWGLDKRQAGALFRLSTPLREGELHDFDWLPCSISGRLRAEGRVWDFTINAAGTSTWRSGDDARMLGCSQAACEALVLLMPEKRQD